MGESRWVGVGVGEWVWVGGHPKELDLEAGLEGVRCPWPSWCLEPACGLQVGLAPAERK